VASSRNTLRRLRIFAWFIAALGAVQAVGAAFAATRVEQAGAGVQLAVAVGIGFVGASTVAARSRFLRRPWRFDDESALAIDFAVRVLVQLILALGAANVAYAGAILTGAPWMVVLGLVFFLPPVVAALPTSRNLARVQAELDEQGSPFELVDALRGADSV
jgi:hypothetical protein